MDLYRPQYGILENVVNMASTRTGYEDQNVLSHVVACLVSMGYQVNQYIMDAWNYGSAQQRSRVFLCIAAPGLDPIVQPEHTHSRPYEDTGGRSLGTLPNGQRFGEREHYATPFTFMSARTVTSDLPDIGNGNVQSCIPFPDHRLARTPACTERALIERIPINPPGCGYKEALAFDLVPPLLQKHKKEVGRSYRRIKANGLVATITTTISLQDARNGAMIHWSQHRSISILEARRVQGYPDEEVIIGNPAQQYEIVGNGVDRKVAFALGLALRHSLENHPSNSIDATSTGYVEQFSKDESFLDDASNSVEQGQELRLNDRSIVGQCPSVEIPARTRTIEAQTKSTKHDTARAAPGSSGADESPDVSTPIPDPSQPTRQLILAQSNFSRSSSAVTRRIEGFLLSTDPLLESQKRRRNDCHSEITETSPEVFTRQASSEVSAITKTSAETSTEVASETSGEGSNFSKRAKLSTGMRHTRHSGLIVEYVPVNWNKRPESEQHGRRR